jgi:hypothetical protein
MTMLESSSCPIKQWWNYACSSNWTDQGSNLSNDDKYHNTSRSSYTLLSSLTSHLCDMLLMLWCQNWCASVCACTESLCDLSADPWVFCRHRRLMNHCKIGKPWCAGSALSHISSVLMTEGWPTLMTTLFIMLLSVFSHCCQLWVVSVSCLHSTCGFFMWIVTS